MSAIDMMRGLTKEQVTNMTDLYFALLEAGPDADMTNPPPEVRAAAAKMPWSDIQLFADVLTACHGENE